MSWSPRSTMSVDRLLSPLLLSNLLLSATFSPWMDPVAGFVTIHSLATLTQLSSPTLIFLDTVSWLRAGSTGPSVSSTCSTASQVETWINRGGGTASETILFSSSFVSFLFSPRPTSSKVLSVCNLVLKGWASSAGFLCFPPWLGSTLTSQPFPPPCIGELWQTSIFLSFVCFLFFFRQFVDFAVFKTCLWLYGDLGSRNCGARTKNEETCLLFGNSGIFIFAGRYIPW